MSHGKGGEGRLGCAHEIPSPPCWHPCQAYLIQQIVHRDWQVIQEHVHPVVVVDFVLQLLHGVGQGGECSAEITSAFCSVRGV